VWLRGAAKAGPGAVPCQRPGILRRIYAAIVEGRQPDANRQMALLLSQSGGRLTDDIERQLAERLMRNGNVRL
jgi:hypothetical protein